MPVDQEPTTTVRRESVRETVGTQVEESATPAGPFTDVPLFANLDAESLRELERAARQRRFRAGEVIFHRDDPGQVLYVIREGKVKICINSPDGHEVVLAVFGPGDYFGELALLDGQPRSASAVAHRSGRGLRPAAQRLHQRRHPSPTHRHPGDERRSRSGYARPTP